MDAGPLEQRTIDFPPSIPARSSSVSTPTSRDTSRAASLTAESLEAPHPLQDRRRSDTRARAAQDSPERKRGPLPDTDVLSPTSIRFDRDDSHDLLHLGRHDDAVSKKYSSRNTPFSIASFETSGTAPEVSEAMAVHMYPHQNSSVLMVDHLAKPAAAAESTREGTETGQSSDPPVIRTTSPNGGLVTPPAHRSTDEVDSPLRNPRPPPPLPRQPPAIHFIPATPSGSTPAHERLSQLGNYFEATGEPPPRRPSLVRRALGRRRHSVDHPPTASKPHGLLTRTFSLSRNVRHLHSKAPGPTANPDVEPVYPQRDAAPAEQDKLHPFWRPHATDDEESSGAGPRPGQDGGVGHDGIDGSRAAAAADDGWSRAPKRSLSARMKRT
ncbi:hypothetical protein CDD83_1823 [Cordyceps sp. RAO-2017]|nr:hypothetical protein CDD83_1823 [Cordyceps sp. RAO-2017]